MDHLCNLEVADRFGQYFARIPIPAAAHIVCANALTMDWGELLKNGEGNGRVEGERWRTGEGDGRVEHKEHKECFDYVFGNPPFLGAMLLLPEQKEGLKGVFGPKQKLLGELDFVTAWFKKASDLIQETNTRCAFVSTNSIT